MYDPRADIAGDYRPGYNPEFVKQARENVAKRELAEHLERIEQARLEEYEAQRRAAAATEEMKAAEAKLMEVRRATEFALAHLSKSKGRYRRPFSRIQRTICLACGVTQDEILSRRRGKRIVKARQAIFYWASRLTNMSLPEIGRRMDRDHTSVLYGRDVYPNKRAAMGRTLRKVR